MKIASAALLGTAAAIPAAVMVAPASARTAFDSWLDQLVTGPAPLASRMTEAFTALERLKAILAQLQAAQAAAAQQPPAPPAGGHAHHAGGDVRPAPTPSATAAPAPMPGTTTGESAPTGRFIPTPGLDGLAAVASGLAQGPLLKKVPPADTGRPDVVGAFRFLCQPSHLAYADPVMFPGDKTGKSHLHLFFGNTAANADSTFESLRRTGDSSCINPGNRSAYWKPALIQTNGAGRDEVVMPTYLNIYYKRRPASDPWYRANGVTPVNLPRGLRYIFGWPTVKPQYKCVDPRTWSEVGTAGPDMQAVLSRCPVGAELYAIVDSPGCWDGKNLDSPDHRSHMSYTRGGAEHNWVEKCPSTHPYEIPKFTLQAAFKILPTDRPATWRFSSDMMMPGARPGSTFHADWFGAWEDSIADTWQEWCINKLLTCASGNLGNGTMMEESATFRQMLQNRDRRVPVPAV
ncbi:DUF1996 domain-containing protein [Erythrobacteraceae bacterium CFH 75059]|uniref:DUF1996 domain-containing protein n=1 Tax=Qipengyuania thermophila TaxID=2509361 RepID=UPI00101F9B9C|nr:DUF1996 domain-containing protein [Qipengyuania thermophila]TCD06202.1 DUF1996 domain-containing protein [Erythrobacteraceae bacterium CFH 75059]